MGVKENRRTTGAANGLKGKTGEGMSEKNGEVSLWKINSAVERKGLPSTAFRSQPLDRQ